MSYLVERLDSLAKELDEIFEVGTWISLHTKNPDNHESPTQESFELPIARQFATWVKEGNLGWYNEHVITFDAPAIPFWILITHLAIGASPTGPGFLIMPIRLTASLSISSGVIASIPKYGLSLETPVKRVGL